MVQVKVEQPTPAEIKQHPREFALLTQITGYDSGSVDSQVRIHS